MSITPLKYFLVTYNERMKILLVDDDAFLRDMYATKFTEAGHEVVAAHNGESCLIKIKEQKFDVVLLDMVMPGITGLQLLEHLNEVPEASEVKRIVLSNQSEQTDIQSATNLGAIGYIVKAESIPSEVVQKVESLMTK